MYCTAENIFASDVEVLMLLEKSFWHLCLIITVRLHVMQRTVLLSQLCPSVCLSVRCVYCDKTKAIGGVRTLPLSAQKGGSKSEFFVFTARRYASAVLAVIVCPSVRPSVRLSQVGVVQRWLNLGSD